ncbi:unnamed protein product [Protopolystoma xenopodis]|uniref:Uncharacterized protein n=1 Tax=Protopolystoma xenopodis TaxID=117903 RepID=A0A3S5AQW6_9PLAT|nr:unnamed protein product [Protopolystoma xenopodis]
MTDESLACFHRNRRRLPRIQRQHESASKANRQLVRRNPPSSCGGTDLRISSLNTFTRNGSVVLRIAGPTDDAGEKSENVVRPRSDFGDDHAYNGLRTRSVPPGPPNDMNKLRKQGQTNSIP